MNWREIANEILSRGRVEAELQPSLRRIPVVHWPDFLDAIRPALRDEVQRVAGVKLEGYYGLLTRERAARYLGIKRSAFDALRKKYDVPRVMIARGGRYDVKDLDKVSELMKAYS